MTRRLLVIEIDAEAGTCSLGCPYLVSDAAKLLYCCLHPMNPRVGDECSDEQPKRIVMCIEAEQRAKSEVGR